MGNINYKLYGDGDINVIMLHGWASSHTMWANVHPHFKNAKLWALDLPGFGNSPISDNPTSIDDYAKKIIDFCDEHVQPQMIVAHSTGGIITLKALTMKPDLAQQLVLISPVVTGRFGLWGAASDVLRHPLGVAAFRATKSWWSNIQNEDLLRFAVTPWHTNQDLAKRIQSDFMNTDPEAGIETLVSMAHENMEEHLSDMHYPTLVCVGDEDLTVPPGEGKTAALYMPNAELATFKARHHPMDEATSDFVPKLCEFIGRFGMG